MEQEGRVSGRKRLQRILAIVLAGLIAALLFVGGWLVGDYVRDPRLRRLGWIIDTIHENYYQEVDLDALYEELYNVVMPDEYSTFYTKEEYDRAKQRYEGIRAGSGVNILRAQADLPTIQVVVDNNSPAYLAGMRTGMYVLGWSAAPNGDRLTGSYSDMTRFLKEHTACVLYADYDAQTPLDRAAAYPITQVEYSKSYCNYRDNTVAYDFRGDDLRMTDVTAECGAMPALDAETAYIRLSAFEGTCVSEFELCIQAMQRRGKSHLILDLRLNGGGFLQMLVMIASYLMRNAEGDSPIVMREQMRDGTEYALAAPRKPFFHANGSVTVLADEWTASASEALIGAMIDYGTIAYGDLYLRQAEDGSCRTYGKGIGQSRFTRLNGDVLTLTHLRALWPISGRCIHGVGITPQDGANAVVAPLLPGKTDSFLDQVIAKVCAP